MSLFKHTGNSGSTPALQWLHSASEAPPASPSFWNALQPEVGLAAEPFCTRSLIDWHPPPFPVRTPFCHASQQSITHCQGSIPALPLASSHLRSKLLPLGCGGPGAVPPLAATLWPFLLHGWGSLLWHGGVLAALPFLEEGVVRLAQALDVDHLVVVHTHGGQGVGHLLLSEATHKMSGPAKKEKTHKGGNSDSYVCVCVCVYLFACVCVVIMCVLLKVYECLYACVWYVCVCTHARMYDPDQCHAHSNSLPLVQFIMQQHFSSPS